MFYQRKMDQALRFGDVLRGYISATPNIKEPLIKEPIWPALNEGYTIGINLPIFTVVLSPCCSIGKKTIALTPLIKLQSDFFKNPYFAEDFTRINRKMEPEKSVPPDKWAEFSQAQKRTRIEEGQTYVLVNLFVYEKHDLFPKYTIRTQEINYYMIDFRNTYKLNCQEIITPQRSPLDSKCLQLSTGARSELRDKIAFYYTRVPVEDKILED